MIGKKNIEMDYKGLKQYFCEHEIQYWREILFQTTDYKTGDLLTVLTDNANISVAGFCAFMISSVDIKKVLDVCYRYYCWENHDDQLIKDILSVTEFTEQDLQFIHDTCSHLIDKRREQEEKETIKELLYSSNIRTFDILDQLLCRADLVKEMSNSFFYSDDCIDQLQIYLHDQKIVTEVMAYVIIQRHHQDATDILGQFMSEQMVENMMNRMETVIHCLSDSYILSDDNL